MEKSASTDEPSAGELDMENLPDELILMLLSFLPMKDLLTCHLLCRRFLRLAEDNSLWRTSNSRYMVGPGLDHLRWKDRLHRMVSCWSEGKFIVTHRLDTLNQFGGIRFVSFCENEQDLLVAGSTQGHVVIWNLADTQLDPNGRVDHFHAHQSWVRCVVRRDNTIFSCSGDHYIKIWSLSEKKMIHTFAHSDQVNLLKLIPDASGSVSNSTMLLSASDDSKVCQWDIEQGKCVHTFAKHSGWVLALDCDHNKIVSAGQYHPLTVWDIRTGSEERSGSSHRITRFLELVPGSDTTYLGGDTFLESWDIGQGTTSWIEPSFDETAWVVRTFNSRILVGADGSDILTWNACGPKPTKSFSLVNEHGPNSDCKGIQSLQCASTRIVCSSVGGFVHVWGPDEG